LATDREAGMAGSAVEHLTILQIDEFDLDPWHDPQRPEAPGAFRRRQLLVRAVEEVNSATQYVISDGAKAKYVMLLDGSRR